MLPNNFQMFDPTLNIYWTLEDFTKLLLLTEVIIDNCLLVPGRCIISG